MAESNERRLKLLISKSEMLFQRLNKLYGLTKGLSGASESRSQERFLSESETIEDLHNRFEAVVDLINDTKLSIDKDFIPEYDRLISFEDMYTHVMRTRNILTSKATTQRDLVVPKIATINLPPIPIPSFNGNAEDWPIFFESFKTNVHTNTQLNNSQRVQYLIGKLTGSALNITAGIIPSGENYSALWDSLVKKYQDRRALGSYYLKNIFDIKSANNTAGGLNAFIENYVTSVSALKQLGVENLTDFILLSCALRKLDIQTTQMFEMTQRDKEIPCYQDLVDFLRSQVKILERINTNNTSSSTRFGQSNENNKINSKNNNKSFKTFVARGMVNKCSLCSKDDHILIYECPKFKNMTVKDRFNHIKSKNGCVNCLSFIHTTKNCRSTFNCKKCQKRHHSLLHFDNFNPQNTSPTQIEQTPSSSVNSLSLNATRTESSTTVVLATAQVYAHTCGNDRKIVRCLLDNGSQNNLITIYCCKSLNLKIVPLQNSYLKGVGLSSRPIKGYVYLTIESRISSDKYQIHALVVDSITDQLPMQVIESNFNMNYLNSLPLADLTWNIPGCIDIVLGAQLFPYIYFGDRVDSGSHAPPAIRTSFGYVLMGDMPCTWHTSRLNSISLNTIIHNELDLSLHKFWELEEIPSKKYLSPEETACENSYNASVTRGEFGRYSVALPFCGDPKELGNSRNTAYRRLMTLERKFKHDPTLRENYNKVINEYIEKEYLVEIAESDVSNDGYYIPHHAITRPDKPMPRIVLDASSKTHTGISLNDILYSGPNLQANLFSLLLDFRLFPVAMTADIKQMYLQIGTLLTDRKFLKILFRFNNQPSDLIRVFQFNRIPFGLKSSPYLAMRTVHQLASDMRIQCPEAAAVAESKLYMDDLVHSMPDEESAIRISRELILLFKSGSFELIKWTSNSLALLNDLPDSHRSVVDFTEEHNNNTKVLGLSWEPVEDNFFLTTLLFQEKCTKRNILSLVARLFDVLGLVAPVILYAKLLIKELWLCNIGWDDVPPESIIQRFTALTDEFPVLSTLKIPRHIGVLKDSTVNIVAFCDASMNGYGSAVYLHATDLAGNISIRLLCAKSKVSPTKVITLARLELCAALLMSKLVKSVRDNYGLRITIAGTYAFSDSTIALSWIRSSPHRWSIFVSNRVAQCQENIQSQNYYHIAGIDNPSDCLSRGMLPSRLVTYDLWWNGPTWLRSPISEWPIQPFLPIKHEELPEFKTITLITAVVVPCSFYELAQNVSRWDKLLRIVAYCLRFMKRIPRSSVISVSDLIAAEKAVILAVQSVHFVDQIKDVKKGKITKQLKRLSPFIDEDGILRIEGRLSKSDLPFETKHPALLPKHDHAVDLLIDHYHKFYLHTGPGLLMSILRQRFWVLSARNVIRWRVNKCNTCFRSSPSHPTPKMADLPAYRISQAKAFMHTGVDYAGPFRITLSRRRGQHSQKAYMCLFVCLVTKAVHIELVSDLSADAFLAAFKRFISRRGPVSCIYSDNGTNFVGAKAQLNELNNILIDSNFKSTLLHELTNRRIDWKMIPPRAAHFGGLWESNIKSFKTHFYRVVGTQLLTYEEMLTVLVQIECLLNSRPLCILSSDPHPEVLTPAHFLMSTPLQYLPAPDLTNERIILTNRKRLLDNLVQSYWKKWHLEYLHTLQVRQKWCTPENPVTVGAIVIVGQENAPPLSWPLGIITQIYPGTDGVVRVALVKTNSGIFKRPIVKLYPLPTQ